MKKSILRKSWRQSLAGILLLFVSFQTLGQSDATLTISNVEAPYGSVVLVPVTATVPGEFWIIELNIEYNPSVVHLDSITNIHPNLPGLFETAHNDEGYVSLNYMGVEPVTLPANTKLFDLSFSFCNDMDVCIAAGGSSTVIFSPTRTNLLSDVDEFYNAIDYNLILNNGSVYSDESIFTLTIGVVGEGDVYAGDALYTEPMTFVGGSSVSLLASPDEDWRFVEWQNDLSGSGNPKSIVMNGDKHVTAVFSDEPIPQYELNIEKTGLGNVTVNGTTYTGPMLFDENTEVTIAATPQTGYNFSGFSGDLTAATSPQTITMNSNKNINATFTIKTYTLTINKTGSGAVEVDGITYTTQLVFEHGDTPTLEAIPGDFHDFAGWSGSLTGSENPKSITMNGNKTVTASFTPFQYTLTIHVEGNGTVDVDNVTYTSAITFDHGDNPTLLAVSDDGWKFVGWSGDITGQVNPQNLLMDADKELTATFSIKQYTLSIEQNGQGTVLVDGDPYTEPLVFDHGDTPQLQAVADDGWQFNNWSGDIGGNNTPQSLLMNGDKQVTANFSLKQYTLTINVIGGGIVRVNGAVYNGPMTFDHGSTPSLQAIANDYHNFDGWSGNLTGILNPQDIEMTGNKTVNASFSPFQYTLDINTNGNGSVTVDGATYTGQLTFNHGDTPLLQASGATGWQFNGWSGDLAGLANPVNLLMNGNKSITANFELNQYTLTINTIGAGTVLVNGTTYTGPMLFTHGDMPSLQAIAGDYHNFSGWGGNLSGSTNPEVLLMNGNKTVQANFSPFQYTLTIGTTGQGFVEVNNVSYTGPLVFNHGDQPLIRAFANNGWQFDEWGGALTGTTNPQNLLINENKHITASFSEIPPDFYTLTVAINGGGSVMVNGNTYTSPMGFEEGTELNLEAIADNGWIFTGWSGDIISSELTINLQLNEYKNLTATFEREQYSLSIGHTGAGAVWIDGMPYTGPLTFSYEDTPQILAIPDEGWLFDGWSGDLGGHENPTGLMMDSDKAVEAHFILIPPSTFTLTIATQGSGSVRVNDITYTDPLPFEEQTEVTLEAIPDEGWLFDGWSGDLGGHENPTVLMMDDDKAVQAHFVVIPPATFTLTIATSGNGSVRVNDIIYTDPIAFEEHSEALLEAIPDEGWLFDGWSGDLGGHENPTGLMMDSDKAVQAHFVVIPPATFTLTIITFGQGKASVNGISYSDPIAFEEGTEVNLEAIPDEGWQFDGWSGNLTGNTNPASFLMSADKSVIATFSEIPPPTYSITFVVGKESDGAPVNDAVITLNETENTPGLYFFDNLPSGEYAYIVSREGYLDVSGVIIVTDQNLVEAVALASTVNTSQTDFINLTVYPNPARYYLHIESGHEMTGVELINMLGQPVYTAKPDHVSYHRVDVGRMEHGIYILRVHTSQHTQTVRIQLYK